MRGKIIWTIIIVGVAALLSLSFWPTGVLEPLGSVLGKGNQFIMGLMGIGTAPAILDAEDVRLFMQIFLTITVGIASLIVATGMLLGHWMRGI